jgi:manganese/zinc/iron transport system permease protein
MDYNTRLVILGCAMLGAACGLVGVFLLLRKRSLIADAICHASLPGIAIAFFVSLAFGGQGRQPLVLLAGAALSGCLGALAVMALRRFTQLKEDAALGIVLSVFFALGMVLLSLVQQTESGNAAGLEGFIYGNTAGIVAQDAKLIAIVCGMVCAGVLLLRKELQLLCFDPT